MDAQERPASRWAKALFDRNALLPVAARSSRRFPTPVSGPCVWLEDRCFAVWLMKWLFHRLPSRVPAIVDP